MSTEILRVTSVDIIGSDNEIAIGSFCGPKSILEISETRKMIDIAIGKRGGYHNCSMQLTKEQALAIAHNILTTYDPHFWEKYDDGK
jgi:hypothetical protein